MIFSRYSRPDYIPFIQKSKKYILPQGIPMYNYQQHQRKQKLWNECKKVYQQFLDDNSSRKNLNNTFYNNFKKRIDAFTLSVVESPIEIDQYVPPVYNPRSAIKSTNPIKSFKMNSHTTAERLEPIIDKNSYLDCTPVSNPSLHQFKDYSSHKPYKPFKFTPSCTAVRLMDHLVNSRTNQIQSCRATTRTISKLRRNIENYLPEDRKPRKQLRQTLSDHGQKVKYKPDLIPNKYMKQIQKVFMPGLHRKVYFNSMKSLLVEPGISKAQSIENDKQNNDRHDLENEKDLKKIKAKSKTHEHVNRKENAINAMIRCKLMKSKTSDTGFTKDSVRA